MEEEEEEVCLVADSFAAPVVSREVVVLSACLHLHSHLTHLVLFLPLLGKKLSCHQSLPLSRVHLLLSLFLSSFEAKLRIHLVCPCPFYRKNQESKLSFLEGESPSLSFPLDLESLLYVKEHLNRDFESVLCVLEWVEQQERMKECRKKKGSLE